MTWEKLADSYSKTFGGREISPDDLTEYPMAIMSLLSDAQHVGGLDGNSEANAYVNAAKVMLLRMKKKQRTKCLFENEDKVN